MIVKKHDARGWWAMDDRTGERVVKPCATEAELDAVIRLVASARLAEILRRMGELD